MASVRGSVFFSSCDGDLGGRRRDELAVGADKDLSVTRASS